MLKKRLFAGMIAAALLAGMTVYGMGETAARRGQGLSAAPFLRGTAEALRPHWWGVLYADSLLLARVEEEEGEPPDTGEKIEFVWPLWQWLLGLLGLA